MASDGHVIRLARPWYISPGHLTCTVSRRKFPSYNNLHHRTMADPYNPYTSYSTPAPGGVGYYPPDEQNQRPEYPHQQSYDNYGNTEGQQPPNYNYNAQASPYHLAPDAYQDGAQERSYTPAGQPDHQGPASMTGMPPSQAHGGNAPANAGY